MLTLLENLDRRVVAPVVVLTKEGALAEACRARDVPVVVMPLAERANVFGKRIPQYGVLGKLRVGLALAGFNARLWCWLRAEGIDSVYCNDLRAVLYVGAAARLRRLPVLWYVRADQRRGWLQAIGARLATRIVLIAEGVRRAFTPAEQRAFAGKFRIVHTGFPIADYAFDARGRAALRKEWGAGDDTFVIGLVGSVTPRKGHDLLIEALAGQSANLGDFRVVLVGDATDEYESYRAELGRKIARADLSGRVLWLGRRTDMSAVYSALDLMVLPSRSEGLPRTVCEGLLVGIPTVATDVGGVRDVLCDKRLGHVVPVDDRRALGEAIAAAGADWRNGAARFRGYRRRHIEDNFTVEAYVRGVTELILGDLG